MFYDVVIVAPQQTMEREYTGEYTTTHLGPTKNIRTECICCWINLKHVTRFAAWFTIRSTKNYKW